MCRLILALLLSFALAKDCSSNCGGCKKGRCDVFGCSDGLFCCVASVIDPNYGACCTSCGNTPPPPVPIPIPVPVPVAPPAALPSSYDPSDPATDPVKADCLNFTHHFAQGECNSCWAGSAVMSYSDRWCFQYKQKKRFSVQELVNCGGWACSAPNYNLPYLNFITSLRKVITQPSVGLYTEECQPYTSINGQAAPCSEKCKDGSTPKNDRYLGKNIYWIHEEELIKADIFTKGPVWTNLGFYNDQEFTKFITWNVSKVWSCEDYMLWQGPGHVVKLYGWGEQVEDGKTVQYWLAWNPWGYQWPASKTGYFKLLRNERDSGTCRAQTNVWAVDGLTKV